MPLKTCNDSNNVTCASSPFQTQDAKNGNVWPTTSAQDDE